MTIAVGATPSLVADRSLPLLSGGLLAAYRLCWLLLALGSLATLASLALEPAMGPLVLGLRLAKGIVLLAVSWILLRRRKDDPVAALLSLALLLWSITSSFDLATGDLPVAVILADRLRFLFFALALLLFPDGRWSPVWTRYVAASAVAVFLLGMVEGLGATSARLFLPLAILCILASLAALLARYRSGATTAERQQVKWIALGLVVGITLILAARASAGFNVIQSELVIHPLLIEAILQLGIICIAFGFLVSLLRYRLYDAEAVISRSATYAVLTLSLVATFAGSEALVEMIGQQYFGPGIGSISATMAAAVAAVLLAPLHGRITSWAERRFQRDLVDLKEQLPELLAELVGTSSTARVGETALPRIAEALHSIRSALIVDDRIVACTGLRKDSCEKWVRDWPPPQDFRKSLEFESSSDFSMRMALRCPFGTLRGWLLLGPRPDASPYSRDDVEALESIRRPLRTALFAAREREKERERELSDQRTTRRQLSGLVRRLAALEANIDSKRADKSGSRLC